MLLLLLLIPLLAMFYTRIEQRRQRIVARYGSLGLVRGIDGRKLTSRRYIPAALFLSGLTILIVALARPQATIGLPRIEGTVILAFDVSGSMAADDVKPTRMEAAKEAARDFVQSQPSTVQIGVVAFSEGGLAVQVPTNEQSDILDAIERLAPQRGTSIGEGILASLNTIAVDAGLAPLNVANGDSEAAPTPTPVAEGSLSSAVIVLLTDGENNADPDPIEAAQMAADLGVRVYTIGIGSAAGTTLEVNGFSVHTQLDEPTLQQISQLSDGVYYNAENEEELHMIYDNLELKLVVKPEELEVTSLLAGASLFVLLIGGAYSLRWFSRVP